MPRHNNTPRVADYLKRYRRNQLERLKARTATDPTYDEIARDLVRAGLASRVILGPGRE